MASSPRGVANATGQTLRRPGAARALASIAARESDFRAYAAFAARHWRLLAGSAALFLSLGAVFVALATPLYTASTQVLFEARRDRLLGPDVLMTPAGASKRMIKSQIAVIRSSALLRRIVERERLAEDPEFGAAAASLGTRKAVDAAVDRLKSALSVTLLRYTRVIQISVTSADPAKAARLADAVAEAYLVDKLDARLDAARRASTWLSERSALLRRKLRESEDAVARFRAQTDAPPLGSAVGGELLGRLNERAARARAETQEQRARVELLQRIEARGGSVDPPGDSEAVEELRRRRVALTRREAELRARYNAVHPSVRDLRAQIDAVDRAIREETRKTAADTRNRLELAVAEQASAEASLREAIEAGARGDARAVALRELERAAAADRRLYDDVRRRARVVEAHDGYDAREARVISPALAPLSPSWPDDERAMLVALALGLIVGVGLAYGRDLRDRGFTTPDEIEAALALPLLASIAKMSARELTVDGVVLTIPEYVRAKPLSRLSEALRMLRSAIRMSDVDHPPAVVQFTSTVPGEGTTTLAMAFAASAAHSGAKVLFVDADLRQSSASRRLAAERRAGLVDCLVGAAEPGAAILFDETLKLWALPSGGETRNPADLLASDRMKRLIAALRADFDLVVLDTPPVGPVVDPLKIAAHADKIVFVVRWAATEREMVAHAITRLPDREKAVGVVLDQIVDVKARRYGRYAYARYYGERSYEKYYAD